MIINKEEFKNHINFNLKKHDLHLSMRISYLMDQLKIFQNHNDDEIDLFEVLVRLIFLADKGPVDTIANLLVPLNTESSYLLDKSTISEAASLIRDFLKRDYIFYILTGDN